MSYGLSSDEGTLVFKKENRENTVRLAGNAIRAILGTQASSGRILKSWFHF
ncbi:MAG: hypothetical protein ABF328_00700 [Akkermansiaceae bacterium]